MLGIYYHDSAKYMIKDYQDNSVLIQLPCLLKCINLLVQKVINEGG